MEYNWDTGNLVGVREKNLLIIAENIATNSSGYIKSPDDEKAGGRIIVGFSRPLSAFGFDLLDMEVENAPLSSIQFYWSCPRPRLNATAVNQIIHSNYGDERFLDMLDEI